MANLSPSMPNYPPADPRPKRWSQGEYHRLADLGLLGNQRTELVEGEILFLGPQGPGHFSTTDRVAEILRRVVGSASFSFGGNFHSRSS